MNRKMLRQISSKLSKSNVNFKSEYFKLLNRSDLEGISKIMNLISNRSNLETKLAQTFLPKSLNILAGDKIYCNAKMQLSTVLSLTSKEILFYAKQINRYIILKNQYEDYLFSNKLSDAHETIIKLESEICVSIWSTGQKLVLEEKINGLESQKKLLEEYLKRTKLNIVVATLISYKSYMAEKGCSYTNYQDYVQKYIRSLNDSDIDPYIGKYMDFKINLDCIDVSSKIMVLQIDNQFSIIDLYESLIRIQEIESFSDDYDIEIAKQLNDYIDDRRLLNIILVKGIANYDELAKKHPYPSGGYNILEQYTMGNYTTSAKMALDYYNSNSSDFQAIVLLAKSLINGDLSLPSQNMSEIFYDIYNIYTLSDDINESITDLLNYKKQYSDTSWFYKICGFISRKYTLVKVELQTYLSQVNDHYLTPNIVSNMCDRRSKKMFLEYIYTVCPCTSLLHMYYYGIINNFSNNTCKCIDSKRKQLYIASKCIVRSHASFAIHILTNLRTEIDDTDLYNIERINRRLVSAYISIKSYDKLLETIVQAYFVNPYLTSKLNLKDIINKILKYDNDTIWGNITFPLFTYICDKNDLKSQRIAYSNYMDINNISTIQNIIEKEKGHPELLTFFLSKMCTQYIMSRDVRFIRDGSDIDNVRIDILRSLIEIDPLNRKQYHEEISNLTTQKSIRNRISQINQTKVFVDAESIKNENLENLKETYSKYIAIKHFKSDIKSLDVTSEEAIQELKKIVTDFNFKVKSSPSYTQEILVLKSINAKIIEEFLYNEKYGLNTYLSSRVRHGYCKTQLTSVFDDYNLMCKKKDDSSRYYSINEYWDTKLPKESSNTVAFKKALSNFTNKIESKVDEIKINWLSIKYKEGDCGKVLDYSSCLGNSLYISSLDNIADFDGFYNLIIEFIWEYTEECLHILRRKITSELLMYFLCTLDDLDLDISMISSSSTEIESYKSEIKNSINMAKAKIRPKVIEFSDVFYKRDVSYMDFTMEDLLETCLEISQKLSLKFTDINLLKYVSCNYTFCGVTFPYFVDILTILINNALEHAGFDDYKQLLLDVNIQVLKDAQSLEAVHNIFKTKNISKMPREFVQIRVCNNLSKLCNSDSILEKIKKIFDDMKDFESLKKYTQSEGGTGLYKIYKTLQYNINALYAITYEIDSSKFALSIFMGIDNIIVGNEG